MVDVQIRLNFDINSNLFSVVKEETTLSAEQKPAVSKSGRKIKGRGTIVRVPLR